MSGNLLLLGKKIFEIPPIFKSGQGICAKKVKHGHYVFPSWTPRLPETQHRPLLHQ